MNERKGKGGNARSSLLAEITDRLSRVTGMSGAMLLLLVTQACAELSPGAGVSVWEEITRLITFPPSTLSRTQSGTTAMTTTSVVETIESVDMLRSFVQCYYSTTSSNVSNAPTCELTSPTQVTIQSGGTNSNLLVSWSVVEFADGATVQRGTTTLASGATSDTITLPLAVAMSRSFVVVHARTPGTAQNIDEQRTMTARMTSDASILLERNESGLQLEVVWQLVTLTGGFTQTGVTTITNGNTTASAPINTVELNKTFLLGTVRAGANVNGIESDYYVRMSLADTNTVQFTRATGNNSVDIAWFAVSMGDGASVRSGSVSTTGHTETVLSAALNPTIATNRSIPFISATVTGGGTADQDSGTFTPSITSASNINFTRGSNQDRQATVDWFIVEFLAQ